jgi:NADH-quinone oxidoreductase subunit C
MTEIIDVDSDAWAAELVAHADRGYRQLDLLTAVDRLQRLEVLAHLVDPDRCTTVLLRTSVDAADARLSTITPSHPAAAWHERETAEQFGLSFDGHPDPRPLLHRLPPSVPPLRKSTPLEERVQTPWPGAADPDAARRPRRRQLPPGVREDWMATP